MITLSEGCKSIPWFPVQLLTVTFEQTANGRYVDVLLPESMFNLVDYHLRECLKQKVRMRVCRNYGKYFAVMGHSTANTATTPSTPGDAPAARWRPSYSGTGIGRQTRYSNPTAGSTRNVLPG